MREKLQQASLKCDELYQKVSRSYPVHIYVYSLDQVFPTWGTCETVVPNLFDAFLPLLIFGSPTERSFLPCSGS